MYCHWKLIEKGTPLHNSTSSWFLRDHFRSAPSGVIRFHLLATGVSWTRVSWLTLGQSFERHAGRAESLPVLTVTEYSPTSMWFGHNMLVHSLEKCSLREFIFSLLPFFGHYRVSSLGVYKRAKQFLVWL